MVGRCCYSGDACWTELVTSVPLDLGNTNKQTNKHNTTLHYTTQYNTIQSQLQQLRYNTNTNNNTEIRHTGTETSISRNNKGLTSVLEQICWIWERQVRWLIWTHLCLRHGGFVRLCHRTSELKICLNHGNWVIWLVRRKRLMSKMLFTSKSNTWWEVDPPSGLKARRAREGQKTA